MTDDEERKTWPLGCPELTVLDERTNILPDVSNLSPRSVAPPVSEVVVAEHQQALLSPRLSHSSVVRSEELGISEQQQGLSSAHGESFSGRVTRG